MAAFEQESLTKISVVNATRLDFDHKLDWTSLGQDAKYYYVYHDPVGIDPTNETVVERSKGCDVIVTKDIPIRSEIIAALPPSVKLICEAGTGYNNIDLNACRERGICVMNIPSYSTEAVACLVFTFIFNFSCSFVSQQQSLLSGDLTNFSYCLQVPHFEIAGKTIGIIGGQGRIGKRVGEIARAFGMNVLICTRNSACASPSDTECVTTFEDLLQRSDFVTLHCPLTNETRSLMNANTLAIMKPTAYLINTARGGIVDENALIFALQSGIIAGAALDVQDPEPPIISSPLYNLPNVILTPHIGWKRHETRQRLVDAVSSNIHSFRVGEPQNVVI